MKIFKQSFIGFLMILFIGISGVEAQRQMENLDRGLVAVKTTSGVFLSWRLQGYEWYGYTYNLYRDGVKINSEPLEITNYVDNNGTISSLYHVETLFKGVSQSTSDQITPWEQQYLEIPLKTRNTSIYEINDITAADLDGDGQYELIVKRVAKGWNDNNTNYTYFEAYKLDGTFLWEINVGPNILPDVEINIAAFDFDGDGKAEVFMRTSEGTIFGDGTMIGDTNGDGIINYRYSVGTAANMQYMNEGPEFLSLIDGETGVELDRINFIPRGKSEDWGDGYGHRASKYFFGAPYLDGVNPSIFIGRGIYTKTEMRTYDVVDKKLVLRWSWSSGNSGPYFGQGNHNYTIADVDGDGRDEIIWGSMAIDDDGTGLYSTALGHGDAMHIGNFDPYRKGMEAWRCLENIDVGGTVYHDAGTGEILIHHRTGYDTGRCIVANISNNIDGKSMWGGGKMFEASSRDHIGGSGGPENFRIYWDGDLLEELLDHHNFSTSTGYGTGAIYKYRHNGPILLATGATSCNYTKGTPSLQADLFGDWREEVVWRTEDNTAIRIYTTIDPTEHRVYSLMHDHQYRQAIAWQMCGYNQPPHVSFFLGEREGKTVPPPPAISNGRLKYVSGNWTNGAGIWKKDGVTTAFADGDHILFDASAGSDVTVNLNYNVSPHVVSINSPENIVLDATSGKLTGDMQLVKSGAGDFTLKGNHNYSGETEVWFGKLNIEGDLENSNVMLEFFGELDLKGKLHKNLWMRYGSELYVGGINNYGVSTIDGDVEIEKDVNIHMDISNTERDVLNINGAILVNDLFNIKLNIDGELNTGDYTIIELSSGVEFPVEKVNVEGLTGTPYKVKQVDNSLVIEIVEVRDASTVYWAGTEMNNIWNLASSEVFKKENSEITYFVTNDNVVLDNTASLKDVTIEGEIFPNSIIINSSDDYIISGEGEIVGTSGLIKSGSGKLKIQNANSFSGIVELNEGVLEIDILPDFINKKGGIGAPSSDPSKFVINGGVLKLTETGSIGRAVTIGENGGTIENDKKVYWEEAVAGGNFIKEGPGTLILNGDNSHEKLTIRQGWVELIREGANPGQTVVFEGGSLQSFNNVHSYSNWHWNFEVHGKNHGIINMDGRGTYHGTLIGDGTLTVNIPFVRTDFRGNWSQFTGTINFAGDDVRIDNNHGYENAIVNLNHNATLYHLNNRTVKLGALTGEGVLSGNSKWEIGGKNTSFTFDGSINSGSVHKVGTGFFTIPKANTYSGGTTIEKGRITVTNETGSATGSGNVTIENGGVLNGSGSVAGNTIVKTGGRIIAGGAQIGESLSIGGDVNLAKGGSIMLRVNPVSNTMDCLEIGGRLYAYGTLIINRSGGQYQVGQEFKIIDAKNFTGKFEQIMPETPATDLVWDTSELYTKGVIKVVEKPLTNIDNVNSDKTEVYYNSQERNINITLGNSFIKSNDINIKVYNIKGVLVKEFNKVEVRELISLNIADVDNGLYLIKIENKNSSFSQRVLKN